jgi:hypothetical protein
MWTCGGSFASWLKKYTRYGPERRTVGIGEFYSTLEKDAWLSAERLGVHLRAAVRGRSTVS